MNEISFTPGRLAKKIGISRTNLLEHLQQTGLINWCFRSPGGHLKIPYSVALRLVNAPEALAVQPQTTRTIEVPRRQRKTETATNLPPEPHSPPAPALMDYAQIGKTLRRVGITLQDVINHFNPQRQEKQQEASTHKGE